MVNNSFFKVFFLVVLALGGHLDDLDDYHIWEVVNNHGDRKSPKDRVVGPLPMMRQGTC